MQLAQQPVPPRHQRAPAIGGQEPEIAQIADVARLAVHEDGLDRAGGHAREVAGVEVATDHDLPEPPLHLHGAEVRRLALEGDAHAPLHGAPGHEATQGRVVRDGGRLQDHARHQTRAPGTWALHPDAGCSTAGLTAPASWPSWRQRRR